jgi:cytochrome c oxidase assembly protein Cox11
MTTCPSLQFPLAAKTSCTLGFQVSAKSVGEFVLAPKVCEYSGQRCSRPEEDEQVDITVTTPAEDAFVLTPNVTNVSMGTGNTVVVYYTILNASTENFSEVEVADTFSTPVAEAEAVLDANTTCPDLTFPLAPGASCIMGFAITGLSAGEYSLAPEICGFSSEAFCSQPAPTDRVAVTISTAPAFFLFTPNTPSISLAVGATETVYYTVKNMTADNFSTVSVENTFSTDVATATAVLDVNTTCPSLSFPLAAGAECILGFEIIGGGAPGGAGVGSLTLLNVANTLYVGTLGQGVWSLAVPF